MTVPSFVTHGPQPASATCLRSSAASARNLLGVSSWPTNRASIRAAARSSRTASPSLCCAAKSVIDHPGDHVTPPLPADGGYHGDHEQGAEGACDEYPQERNAGRASAAEDYRHDRGYADQRPQDPAGSGLVV